MSCVKKTQTWSTAGFISWKKTGGNYNGFFIFFFFFSAKLIRFPFHFTARSDWDVSQIALDYLTSEHKSIQQAADQTEDLSCSVVLRYNLKCCWSANKFALLNAQDVGVSAVAFAKPTPTHLLWPSKWELAAFNWVPSTPLLARRSKKGKGKRKKKREEAE